MFYVSCSERLLQWQQCLVSLGALLGLCAVAAAPASAQTATQDSWLLDHGILPHVNYLGESAGNVTGGQKQGAAYAATGLAGVDFDLTKLLGIPGAGIHFTMTDRHGGYLATDSLGSTLGAQETYNSENLRLTELSWDQALFNDRLEVKAGRMTLVSGYEFADDLTYCQFQTDAICGAPYLVSFDTSEDVWPVASWGGRARAFLTRQAYLEFGISEDNRGQATKTQHGFNWSLARDTGVFIPVGVGYKTTAATDRFPRWYRAGFAYDSSPYSDPYADAAGKSYVRSGQAPADRRGRSIFWLQADQSVWRPSSKSARGVTLLAGAFFGTSDDQTFRRQIYLGATWVGPFANRPLDSINVLGNDFKMGRKTEMHLADLRASVGGSGGLPTNDVTFELNYAYQATPSIVLRPNFQYIINPTNYFSPTRKNIPDAFILGLQFAVNIDSLVGLPTAFYQH